MASIVEHIDYDTKQEVTQVMDNIENAIDNIKIVMSQADNLTNSELLYKYSEAKGLLDSLSEDLG